VLVNWPELMLLLHRDRDPAVFRVASTPWVTHLP
jgi:hypothetical protein